MKESAIDIRFSPLKQLYQGREYTLQCLDPDLLAANYGAIVQFPGEGVMPLGLRFTGDSTVRIGVLTDEGHESVKRQQLMHKDAELVYRIQIGLDEANLIPEIGRPLESVGSDLARDIFLANGRRV